ncbi:hypothetical protein BpHYR1_000958 [Brachionus plicatilis]|uniref:Uncharacterized protein n=1 Tax=Brachionus plicatilis TaxID=10195 RepID=A0A3M7RD20_BRAPC|nr:hypothetical protein BpHYR1_000958 [Brachionus plicatilis]
MEKKSFEIIVYAPLKYKKALYYYNDKKLNLRIFLKWQNILKNQAFEMISRKKNQAVRLF